LRSGSSIGRSRSSRAARRRCSVNRHPQGSASPGMPLSRSKRGRTRNPAASRRSVTSPHHRGDPGFDAGRRFGAELPGR
jgi:hypothetical protein